VCHRRREKPSAHATHAAFDNGGGSLEGVDWNNRRVPILSASYDVCLLDLDGVVYIGPDAAPYAREALHAAREAGMRLAFVTNNASRPPEAVAGHLLDLGIETSAAEVVTSAQAAARMLADRLSAGARVLVVGGEGLEVALRERGLVPVRSRADDPVAVVQGFDPAVDWTMLAEGAFAVADGLPWVASNADLTIPRPEGIAPGNGALIQVIAAATGRYPDVAGKPRPPMHTETLIRTGAERPLVVGDRLDTDIEGANGARVDSLLVLTGVTSPAAAVTAQACHRPTHIGPDLRALAADDDDVRVEPGRAIYGRWRASVSNGRLEVGATASAADRTDRSPWPWQTQDRLDALRAACGAVWSADDRAPNGSAGVDGDAGSRPGEPIAVDDVTGALTAAGW
jgi:glycerol-1-phosphatase